MEGDKREKKKKKRERTKKRQVIPHLRAHARNICLRARPARLSFNRGNVAALFRTFIREVSLFFPLFFFIPPTSSSFSISISPFTNLLALCERVFFFHARTDRINGADHTGPTCAGDDNGDVPFKERNQQREIRGSAAVAG